MKFTTKLTALVLIVLAFSSCGGEKEVEKSDASTTVVEANKDTTAVTVDDTTKFKFDFTIANIPSPANTLHGLGEWGVAYDNTLLNDPKNADKYSTEFKQSLNLGIYNIDMIHAMANDNGNDVLKYMKTLLVLGDKLGLSTSLNAMVGKRAETNLNNKDSLFRMIDEVFVKSDNYLRTNERVYTATTIFTGSWVEILYLASAISKKLTDEKLKEAARKILWNQRLHLGNLLNLMGDFNNKKELTDLKNELKPIYDQIVSAKQPTDMTQEKHDKISDQIIALRNKIVQ